MNNKDKQDELLKAARTAAQNAYAPYSNYKVGAAVLTGDNRIFTGCNIENASYGLTICAERVAIFNARLHGAKRFKIVAIHAPKPHDPLPCGACRQVMSEGDNHPDIVVENSEGKIQRYKFSDLFPQRFDFQS